MSDWRNSVLLAGRFPWRRVQILAGLLSAAVSGWSQMLCCLLFGSSSALLALCASAFVEELDDRSEARD